MLTEWLVRALFANLAVASKIKPAPANARFTTLVTFGDSYTDENRLGYFINNNGSAPPVGWQQPVGLKTASGGRSWARLASDYSGAKLYNYAVSGAVCSNKVSPRPLAAINGPFPDIDGYEVPAFIADSKYVNPNGTKFFTGKASDTAYAIWIGTNDLGNGAFLTDKQLPGKTVIDYVDCIYDQITRLYNNGARYVVLLNLAPLELLPQYQLPEKGGLQSTQFFNDAPGKNLTALHGRMKNTVAALNGLFKYRTPYQFDYTELWDGATVVNFDVNALMQEIYYHPSKYFNGTAPPNVEGAAHLCNDQGSNCTTAASLDSFMWYDPLHPSEQTSRIIAKEFVNVLGGESKYATYWGE
ncbi:carbohydrate esterase family 16 protein [Bipolaris victoriae FI3]|uniref:Carbohydrate esterase family 16 protein n=2 Tax=Bipolaris TaxID=33194 RepID=W6YYQ6_COCC2|nr:carbohydrate esterase family 16 protein [Bipolaris zeicola 26-R-13]XP_014553039.1 carbohydrate esterase family 16 protein [Bipolaris victoriae FI3]EUC36596.1 carbohydrate esterase family 16 protein [Bipolaris zeicola 26-R-13]